MVLCPPLSTPIRSKSWSPSRHRTTRPKAAMVPEASNNSRGTGPSWGFIDDSGKWWGSVAKHLWLMLWYVVKNVVKMLTTIVSCEWYGWWFILRGSRVHTLRRFIDDVRSEWYGLVMLSSWLEFVANQLVANSIWFIDEIHRCLVMGISSWLLFVAQRQSPMIWRFMVQPLSPRPFQLVGPVSSLAARFWGLAL